MRVTYILDKAQNAIWAYDMAAFTALAMVGATVIKPTIWAIRSTWRSAAGLISASAVNIDYCDE
jgi:hypothetical protein